ncbi:8477_t:CDS:10 [Cetraspora pellucida]|uniref:8477_t:CDS:1 n=1 Tax=Cetraspora pellucida TaxID=1433469 RepID=A0ACA9JXS9_9GLOM|nr:8477_t:CDS:10 [Cetraspora pellucida]
MAQDNLDCPPLPVRWFYAVDVPSWDPLKPPKSSNNSKTPPEEKCPMLWVPFSKRDSNSLEDAYKLDVPGKKVCCNEDYLFEVDLDNREISPIYWVDAIYQVVRATWFYQGDGNNFIPCDENLSTQIEEGYIKHKAWNPASNSDDATSTEKNWYLTDKYNGQYIVYTSPSVAWLDDLTGKFTKTIFAKFTKGEHLGGIRLIRGYPEVEKLISNKKTTEPENKKEKSKESNDQEAINKFRRTLKKIYAANPPAEAIARLENRELYPDYGLRHSKKGTQFGNGIQVIPIHWRQDIKFGIASESEQIQRDLSLAISEDGQPTLDEITLDCVPNLRMLISDALVDGKLVFKNDRNPNFLKIGGKVSLYGHSLGSLLAFDVLCHQPPFVGPFGGIYEENLSPSVSLNDISNPFYRSQDSNINGSHSTMSPVESCSKHFEVQTLYAVGSPIGLFLLLKGLKIGSREYYNAICKVNQLKTWTDISLGNENDNVRNSDEHINDAEKMKNEGNDDIKEVDDKHEQTRKMSSGNLPFWDKEIEHMMQDSVSLIPLCYPACRSVYNIFHKADPIAFRIEPLVARHYSRNLKPALIPYHKGGLKAVQLGFQEFGINVSKTTTNILRSLSLSKPNPDETTIKRKNNRQTREKHFIERELLKRKQLKKLYAEAGSSLSLINGGNTINSSRSSLVSVSSDGRTSIDTGVTRNSVDASFISDEITDRRGSLDSNFGVYGKESPRGLSVEAREKFYMSQVELPSTTETKTKESFYQVKTSSSPTLNEDGQLDYQISGEEKLKSLNKSGRIDYCLQQGVLDVSYISAITDHLNYWADCDAAYFILSETYKSYDGED